MAQAGRSPTDWKDPTARANYAAWKGRIRAKRGDALFREIIAHPGMWATFKVYGNDNRVGREDDAIAVGRYLSSKQRIDPRVNLPLTAGAANPPWGPTAAKTPGAKGPPLYYGQTVAATRETSYRGRLAQLEGEAKAETENAARQGPKIADYTDKEFDDFLTRGLITKEAHDILVKIPAGVRGAYGLTLRQGGLATAASTHQDVLLSAAMTPLPKTSPVGTFERLKIASVSDQLITQAQELEKTGVMLYGQPAGLHLLSRVFEAQLDLEKAETGAATQINVFAQVQKARAAIEQAQKMTPTAEADMQIIRDVGWDPRTWQAIYTDHPDSYRQIIERYPEVTGLVVHRYIQQEAYVDYQRYVNAGWSAKWARRNLTDDEIGYVATLPGKVGPQFRAKLVADGYVFKPVHMQDELEGALRSIAYHSGPKQTLQIPLAGTNVLLPIPVPKVAIPASFQPMSAAPTTPLPMPTTPAALIANRYPTPTQQTTTAAAATMPTPPPPTQVPAERPLARLATRTGSGDILPLGAKTEALREPWPLQATPVPAAQKPKVSIGQAAQTLIGAAYQTGIIPANSTLGQAYGAYAAGTAVTSALTGIGVASSIAGPIGIVLGVASFLGSLSSSKAADRERARVQAGQRAYALRSQIQSQPYSRYSAPVTPKNRPRIPKRFMPMYPSHLGLAASTMTPLAKI